MDRGRVVQLCAVYRALVIKTVNQSKGIIYTEIVISTNQLMLKWWFFFGALAIRARDQPIDDATASRIHFKIKYNNLGLAELEH
jgi:hypothetical protein